MKKLKINVDRPQIKSEDIASRQNFDKVLDGYQKLKPPIFKNPWFYGAIGVASLAILFSIGSINSTTKTDENKITSNIQELPEDTKCIHAPIENVNIDFKTFTVNTSKEETINLPSGTKITIPQGSLISPSNDSKIEIKVRELNTKSESFIAGIPMNAKNGAFESAGMIEIRGFQNENEVKINPNKPIKVNLQLTKNPENFQFWKLNEEKNKWENHAAIFISENSDNVGTDNSKTINLTKNNVFNSIQKIENEIKKNQTIQSNLKSPDRIEFHLPITENQRFDLDFDTKEFPELEKFKGMEFEVSTKKPYDKSFTKKTWNDVSLLKEKDSYFAVFSAKKDKFKIEVRPVLTGQKKEIAEKEFQKVYNEYTNTKSKLIQEEKELLTQKKEQQEKYDQLIKSLTNQMKDAKNSVLKAEIAITSIPKFKADFTVNEFGVYNCDKVNSYPESFKEEVHFSFFNHQPVEVISAFVFNEKKDIRYSYGSNSIRPISSLGVHEKDPNTLIIIDKEGKMGYVLNFNSLKINKNEIELSLLNKKDQNIAFIQKLINEKPSDN
jgi:hypothetical protein